MGSLLFNAVHNGRWLSFSGSPLSHADSLLFCTGEVHIAGRIQWAACHPQSISVKGPRLPEDQSSKQLLLLLRMLCTEERQSADWGSAWRSPDTARQADLLHKCPQKVQTTDKSVGLLVPVGTHHCAISCPQEMNTPTCLKSYLQSCDYSLLLNLAGNHYLLATFYFSEIVSCNKMSSAALSLTRVSVDVITFPFSFKDCRVTNSARSEQSPWSTLLAQFMYSGRCLHFH